MTDFFEEVEEDLRAQRLQTMIKYAPWAGGVIAAVFLGWLGLWGWNTYQEKSVAKASIAYSTGLKKLEAGDQAAADRAFAEAAKLPASGYKALALMQQAGIAIAQHRNADAVKDFDAAAKAAGQDQILSDLASYQAANLRLDAAPYAEMETRLKPLADDKRPFHYQALAVLGMAQMKAGRLPEAKATFGKLRFLAPPDVQQIAQAASEAIDAGDAPRVVDIAKTSATIAPKAAAPQTPSAGSPVPQAGAAAQ